MPLSISRRAVTTALIAFSGVAAILASGTRPTSTAVYRSSQAGKVLEQATAYPLNAALLAWSMVVAVLAVWAIVTYLRGQRKVTQRVLLLIGIMGLVPAILPGLSALAARAFVIREK